MKKSFIDLDKTMLPWLGRTMKGIDLFMGDFFRTNAIDLTKVQVIMLRMLSQNDGQPQNNLAYLTDRDKTSLTRLITTMEKKGLVKRIESNTDRRVNNIFITPKGQDELAAAIPVIKKAMDVIETGLSVDERRVTMKVLEKIRKNINAEELTAQLNN
ncbi:MAG: DNA-binding MarR family transcriptional regulator [Cyclobacteriaceae bacterium]|jgi:DNA-binding MarR family transcriptional regulator